MTEKDVSSPQRPAPSPRNCWYVAAVATDVADTPLHRRVASVPVVLYRRTSGEVVALEDRCAHRGFPLSRGRVEGDHIIEGLNGFTYDPEGTCVSVPSQTHVPLGARVPAFQCRESSGFLWVWVGGPALAAARGPAALAWLTDPTWTTFGARVEVDANFLRLHEAFADITHVAALAPAVAPAVLSSVPPPLEVELTETTVSHRRSFPAAPLAPWHAQAIGVGGDEQHSQVERGSFVSPGLWVDSFEVEVAESATVAPGSYRLQFTQAVTPVTDRHTRVEWRVSRNFASGDTRVTARLRAAFSAYYDRLMEALEILQLSNDADPMATEFHVTADAAALAVRRIVGRMLEEEKQRA